MAEISRAIRGRMKARGEIGADEVARMPRAIGTITGVNEIRTSGVTPADAPADGGAPGGTPAAG